MSSPRLFLPFAVLLAFVPFAFGAGTQKVESKITYFNSIEDFEFIHEGEVKSDLKKCERDRSVDLYGEGSDDPFAGDQTNRMGKYRIVLPGDGIPEDYYTRVRPEHKGSVACKGAESKHKPLN